MKRRILIVPCDTAGMEILLRSLDPWQQVLNIPSWMPFMWETILSYGSSYNEKVFNRIFQACWILEEKCSPDLYA